MMEYHKTSCGWSTTGRLAQFSGVNGDPGQPPAKQAYEASRPASRATHPDWAVIAVLSFMAFNLAALVVAMCIIWAKCRSPSLF